MGERKVINKYYPPDFDPSKLRRERRPKDASKQIKVRMMLPFSLRCGTCGNYIYQGTKFNSRKEDVEGETYLGLRIYRFYFRCPRCASEITMKTDPKNSDYVCELGATRNFEPHREEARQEEDAKRKREEEEDGDAMKALENRALDSKREMEELHALDEIKSANSRNAKLGTRDVIAALRGATGEAAEAARRDEEDEEEVRRLRDLRSKSVRRIDEEEERAHRDRLLAVGSGFAEGAASASAPAARKRTLGVSFAVKPKAAAVVVAKKARREEPQEEEEVEEEGAGTLAGLMGAYASSDEDSG